MNSVCIIEYISSVVYVVHLGFMIIVASMISGLNGNSPKSMYGVMPISRINGSILMNINTNVKSDINTEIPNMI